MQHPQDIAGRQHHADYRYDSIDLDAGEIRRVLKDGGIARFQLNGLPPGPKTPDTWEGVRISRREVADFARDNDLQLLAIEGEGTQYMWTTWRKQPDAWRNRLRNTGPQAAIERSGSAHTGEPVVPQSGRFAYASFRIVVMG